MTGSTYFDSNNQHAQTSPYSNGIKLENIVSTELNAIQSCAVQMQTLVLDYVTDRGSLNKDQLLSMIMNQNTQLSNYVNMIRSKKVDVQATQEIRVSVSNN